MESGIRRSRLSDQYGTIGERGSMQRDLLN
jgi:hypothetical protein